MNKNQNKLDEIFSESKSAAQYSEKYSKYLCELLTKLDHKKVGQIIDAFIEAEKNHKFIYFIGNGGSAATSTHFACDLGKGTKNSNHKFRTQGLADNLSTFTAYANDDGYDYVFSKQLENILNSGDIVVSISASGNSQNLINAINYAKTVGAKTISLLGFDGGKMKAISDISLVIETRKGEYGPVEDIHMVLDHLMTTYIYRQLTK